MAIPEGDDPQLSLKKRARRRLVGAVALTLVAAVVLPMVMDQAPQNTVQEVQIRIPNQEQAQPYKPARGATPAAPAPEAATPVPGPAPKVVDKPSAAKPTSLGLVEATKPAVKGIEKSSEKLVSKPAEKLVDKAAEKKKKTVEKPVETSAGKFVDKAGDNPASKTAEKAVEKSVEKAVEKATDKPTDKVRERSAEKQLDKKAEKSAEKSAVKPVEKTSEKVSSKSAEKSAEKSVEKSATKPIETPTEKSAAKPVEKSVAKPTEKATAKPTEKTTEKTAEKPVDKPVDKPSPNNGDDGRRAAALLAGKGSEPTKPAASSHNSYTILIGAFSQQSNVTELQQKLEGQGVKVYTESLDSQQGKKIRVRVGPFTNKDAAEKALERIKQVGVNGVVVQRQ